MSYAEAYYNIMRTGMVVYKNWRVKVTEDLYFSGNVPIMKNKDAPMPFIINAKDLPSNSICLASTSEFIESDQSTILVLTPDNEIIRYTPPTSP